MRANSFTKVGRAITVAAREGGGDPATNFSLRIAIEKAKEVNFPKDNIDRAIKKGTGELTDGATLEEALYEGFGPGGVGVLVEVVTDNKNRTASDIKHLFSLYGGSMAGPGSVKWQFHKMGVVRLDMQSIGGKNIDEFELAFIEVGADDIVKNDFGWEIRTPVEKLQAVAEKAKNMGIEPADAALEWVAKESIQTGQETKESVQKLYDALDAHDDVRAVFTNET